MVKCAHKKANKNESSSQLADLLFLHKGKYKNSHGMWCGGGGGENEIYFRQVVGT